MAWVATAVAGASTVANIYGANKAASTQKDATNAQIRAQRDMMDAAADAARFRAVGVTPSLLGKSNIQVNDGQLESVGFELSPEMQARADLFGQLGTDVLGRLSADPMQAAQERTQRIQELQAPGRALGQERLYGSMASKGLLGLGVDLGTGNVVNPMMAAQQEAYAQQDAATAAQSYDLSRAQQAEDLRMAQAYFGGQQGLFDAGQSQLAFELGLADIERQRAIAAATGQANFGQNISDLNAAQAARTAQQQSALYSGIGNTISNTDWSSLAGMFNKPTQPATDFKFYQTPPSLAAPYVPPAPVTSSFNPNSAAGTYASDFNFSLF